MQAREAYNSWELRECAQADRKRRGSKAVIGESLDNEDHQGEDGCRDCTLETTRGKHPSARDHKRRTRAHHENRQLEKNAQRGECKGAFSRFSYSSLSIVPEWSVSIALITLSRRICDGLVPSLRSTRKQRGDTDALQPQHKHAQHALLPEDRAARLRKS
eukprot:3443532-Pleurochrysis_carterae.AAC.3